MSLGRDKRTWIANCKSDSDVYFELKKELKFKDMYWARRSDGDDVYAIYTGTRRVGYFEVLNTTMD
jgi:hypothetical protein